MSDLLGGEGEPPVPASVEIEDLFLDSARLTRVSLREAVLGDSVLTGARIEDVTAEGATFRDVRLARARFSDVNLTGADFTDVDLTGVAITDAKLDGMTIDGIPVTDLLARWRDG